MCGLNKGIIFFKCSAGDYTHSDRGLEILNGGEANGLQQKSTRYKRVLFYLNRFRFLFKPGLLISR
jgi:hypothetical protein